MTTNYGESPRNSCKIWTSDKIYVDMRKKGFSQDDHRVVTFAEALNRILKHYRELCEQSTLRLETMEVLRNLKNFEKE